MMRNTEKKEQIDEQSKVTKGRNLSKNYLQSRNFLALLEKQYADDLKVWQTLEPHYTDLLVEQLKTRRKINYLQSLANFAHINVRKVYLSFLPINIIVLILLCLITPDTLHSFYVGRPYIFKACFFFPIAMSLTNLPMLIWSKRLWHDISYRRIQDRLGLLIFKYFEVVDKDKHVDGGYTKRDICNILRRFERKMPYSQDEVANYLQHIIEVEMERKPRGIVYYIYLKEPYFDVREKKRQTDHPSSEPE
ncbi:MAG: hypothetical protein AAF380_02800 [Bacteroidota bacterium]